MRPVLLAVALPLAGLLVGLAAPVVPAAAQSVGGSVIYVDTDATGAETGQSWDDAFTDLQDALAATEAGDEVWVAEGMYTPTDGADRTISFVLASGVGLYGGFDGTEESRDERDWTLHETILSGDVGVPQDSLDNSYHVVVAAGVDAATVLDGLTVQHGRGNTDAPPTNQGGGVHAPESEIVIRHVLFRWNAGFFGGGFFAEGGAPLIEDSVFEDNLGGYGGGAYFGDSNPLLRRVEFRRNRVSQLFFEDGSNGLVEDVLVEDGPAGGLVIIGSSPRFVRVTVRNNRVQSADGGGALIRGKGAAPVFEDCLFEGNRAARGAGVEIKSGASALFLRTTFRANGGVSTGAAVNAVNATPTFLFCRFERNRGSGTGGLSALGSGVTVIGSAFVGNTSHTGSSVGGGLFFTGSTWDGTPTLVANTLFAGNVEGEGAAIAAFGVGPGEALIVNSTFAGNEAREAGGAIYASNAAGLEITNSVLWGNTAPTDPEVFVAEGAPPVIAQSIVAGGYPSGTNILNADPLFVRDPHPGADGRWGTEDDDYGDLRLSEGSPGVDYGLEEYLPPDRWDLDRDGDTTEPLPIDLDGNPRVIGEAPDLGAYEGAVRVGTEPGAAPEAPNALRVWPNPASTTLHVEAPGADEAIVYDVLGREVLRVRLGSSADQGAEGESLPRRVGVSGLAPGVYVVRAGGQSAVVTVRR